MPLHRPSYDVYLNGTGEEPACHRVTITHQDNLRGEAELARAGTPDQRARALFLTTAWCYAALLRMEIYTGPFQRFHEIDCAGIEEPAEGEVLAEADPTRQAADTVSASTYPDNSPQSTGSPPMRP